MKKSIFPLVAPEIAMFRANPAHTGVYKGAGPKQFNELIWKFKTDDMVRSSPAVSDGVVYFGSWDGYLYALYINTGQEKWKFKTDDVVFSSPAVSEGVAYFGSDDGYLYALD
ncbi:MAG: PQQ-binding-like beta-propeller repeat protein, partial [Chloroflexota bacterium]